MRHRRRRGRRIGTAAAAFCRGDAGRLWATRCDDYPVTVRTGYSISEVIVSPDEIFTRNLRPTT
jgi:hypothetical protein